MKQLLIAASLLFAFLLPAAEQKKASDSTIYDQGRMRLAGDSEVKGGSLDVDVKDGVVTVKGRVSTERARQKVDRLSKKTKGVTKVVNLVTVER